MSAELIIGIVFSLVGLLLAAIGIFILIRTRIFLSTAQEVKGTVVRMVYQSQFRRRWGIFTCISIQNP